jgi:GDP-4-dehydro-6-deoxy-D-mannose reductase
MVSKVLIIGHAGFTGKHLMQYLFTLPNVKLFGVDIHKSGLCEEFQINASAFEEIDPIIKGVEPNYIINLAGLNYADNPEDLYKANVFPVISIVRSLQQNKLFDTRVLIISSAAVYGNCNILPIKEESLLLPVNFYGTSKLAMEQVVITFISQIPIIIARPFNILGPGLAEKMSVPSFIKQLKAIKNGEIRNVIKTGNLEPKRDFIDIRDLVKAYWLAISKGIPGEVYNIGLGTSISMADVLRVLIESIDVKVELSIDPALVRKNEIMDSVADISKIKGLGWQPSISVKESLIEMIKN